MGLPNVERWKLWGFWDDGDDDTVLTNYAPSERPTTNIIDTDGVSGVYICVYGSHGTAAGGANNKTATLTISGWHVNGPGFKLWQGTVTVGTLEFNERPIDDITIDTGYWSEVDTYTVTSNACSAEVFRVGDNANNTMFVPTLGRSTLFAEVSDKDGDTGAQVESLAIIMYPGIGSILV